MYGNIYHIIHGVKSAVFNESHDKLKFLECMGAAKEKYDFLLLAYCIMDDHYHLVIKAHNIPISKIMQSINTCFGIYYSRIHKESPRDYKELDSKKIMKELDKILRKICPNDIDFDLIKKGSKKSYLMDYKKKFIEEAKSLAYSSKEIGDCINISDRAVRKHLED